MPKYISVVHVIVKRNKEDQFLQSMKKFVLPEGNISRKVIKTGTRSYCSIMEWLDEKSLANARQQMIAFLDTIRNLLTEISPELGVTNAVSGPLIFDEKGTVVSSGGTITGKIKG